MFKNGNRTHDMLESVNRIYANVQKLESNPELLVKFES
jgi:hypothetical protein